MFPHGDKTCALDPARGASLSPTLLDTNSCDSTPMGALVQRCFNAGPALKQHCASIAMSLSVRLTLVLIRLREVQCSLKHTLALDSGWAANGGDIHRYAAF